MDRATLREAVGLLETQSSALTGQPYAPDQVSNSPDALPLGDLALRRIVSSLYFDGEPITDELLGPFSARWSPWRTYATVYLFTALRAGIV